MGKSQSKEPEEAETDGTSTMTRAIARGRVYIVLRYPKSAEEFDGETMFTEDQFRYLMLELQKKLPDFEITLDAGRTERFCEHLTFYNNSDPNKSTSRPRVLVEVFYTGVYGGINKDMIKRVVQEAVDPNGCCFIDLRCEMGRYHTTPHLETLLRV